MGWGLNMRSWILKQSTGPKVTTVQSNAIGYKGNHVAAATPWGLTIGK